MLPMLLLMAASPLAWIAVACPSRSVAVVEECLSSPLLRRADNSKRDQHKCLDVSRLSRLSPLRVVRYRKQLNPG